MRCLHMPPTATNGAVENCGWWTNCPRLPVWKPKRRAARARARARATQFANFSLSRLIRSNVLSACGAKDEAVCLPMLFRRRAGLLLLLRLRPRELRPPLLGAAWLGDDDELVAALVLPLL